MTSSFPSLDALAPFNPSSWLSRRVALRYPAGRATKGRLAVNPAAGFRRARVADISHGGIALYLSKPLEKGTEVLIQVKNEVLQVTYDVAATVAHARRENARHWLVGFTFARELSESELANLL